MIETRLLQYFLAIAEEQSITCAADYLHITQPTLSKQMINTIQEEYPNIRFHFSSGNAAAI